jgi:hypothetical protein
MNLEISVDEYDLIRRALASHYYVITDEADSLWERSEIDNLERRLISLKSFHK